MTKSLYIAEKPSVAQEFAKALKQNMQRRDGYLRVGNFHRNLVRRPPGYDELPGKIRSCVKKVES